MSLIALLGIILLIGIVKKNAIMMTTFAALFGALPLALQSGSGSELRKPMGIAIVGGLLLSQFITLYTTPVIYLYLDRLAKRLRRRWGLTRSRMALRRQRLSIPPSDKARADGVGATPCLPRGDG